MSQPDHKIKELEDRLDRLVRTQVGFQTEISQIRAELAKLRTLQSPVVTNKLDSQRQHPAVSKTDEAPEELSTAPIPDPQPPRASYQGQQQVNPPSFGRSYQSNTADTSPGFDEKRPGIEDTVSDYFSQYVENARENVEKFIGENLISKIGIIVLILGVGIGAKYAIDNNLISPWARIILGYMIGFGLLGLAVKLKSKYHDFSAVLLSGGMAIMYFITYFAYSSYQLIPQSAAFIFMVWFTAITVVSSIIYSRQVIAHVGLVGAYAVPFLLSNNSGNYAFLFSYMAIINAGILAISIKKSWKPVFYTASTFTWIIFAGWFFTKFNASHHLYLALITLAVFFAIFYATKIVHGIVHSEANDSENVISITITCVIFYLFVSGVGSATSGYGDYLSFFTFVACIALAIVASSFRFYGRILVYVTYPFTWLIFASWFYNQYNSGEHFGLAVIFASVYFLIFYGTALYYRLVTEDIGMNESTGLILTNSFIFYGFGYGILDSRENLRQYEGLFTAAHGVIHSLTAQLVNRFKTSAIDVIQTLAVLIITFATIAIPIQFDGHAVTLIWAVEASVLFYIGRKRSVWLFECLSYPVMTLAAGSMIAVWLEVYSDRIGSEIITRTPFMNGDLVTGLLFVGAFAFIYFTNRSDNDNPVLDKEMIKPFGYIVAAICLVVLYNTFRMEIGNYFYAAAMARQENIRSHNSDLGNFNFIAQLNYTMLFLILMSIINLRKVRSILTSAVNVVLLLLALVVASTAGMHVLYELRESYLNSNSVGLSGMSKMNVAARFLTYAFVGVSLISLYEYCRSELLDKFSTRTWRSLAFDAVLYPCLLVVLNCELMNVAAHLGTQDADKFGLSILWGVFALAVIVIGIAKARKHLRIGAFVLLGATLLKLFFYDATDLPTIPKTILFVSLGLLLLGVSFLYNKFRNVIFASAGNDGKIEE